MEREDIDEVEAVWQQGLDSILEVDMGALGRLLCHDISAHTALALVVKFLW